MGENPPGTLKGSGTGQGGIWHLALAGMLNSAGIDPDAAPWVPSKGAAPGLQELVAGGVEFVTCSVVEGETVELPGEVASRGSLTPLASRQYAAPSRKSIRPFFGMRASMG